MHTNRFQDSTVKAPSPLGRRQSTTFTQNTDHLDQILQSVRQQIERWGSNAKWKIDLVLTEPGQQQSQKSPAPMPSTKVNDSANRIVPLPLINAPLSTSTTSPKNQQSAYSLPVSATSHYPWDYVAPYHDKWNRELNDDQEQLLRESMERNQYLENIVRSQADQIRQSQALPPDVINVVETMKQIYLMSESEQRLRYNTETRMLRKDIQTLTKRLQKTTQLLHSMENLELPASDADLSKAQLLEDRKRLQQKLHLGQLRLKARDAEIEYLHHLKQPHHHHADELIPPQSSSSPQSINASPRFKKDSNHKTRPYLFQQQYSPKLRSDIRPSTISGLDSLGILADQMLSDPDFESQHADNTERSSYTSTPPPAHSSRKTKLRKRPLNNVKEDEPDPTIYYYNRPAYSSSNTPSYYNNEKRSKRSIDSANTLLSMFPSKSPPLPSQSPIQSLQEMMSKDMDKPSSEHDGPQQQHRFNSTLAYIQWAQGEDRLLRSTAAGRVGGGLAYVRWTPDEDQVLMASVEINGTDDWDIVALMVPDRSGQQCRQRWNKYLDPKHAPSTSAKESGSVTTTAMTPTATTATTNSNSARHSPSIASLLNTTTDTPTPTHPPPSTVSPSSSSPSVLLNYHPPSPISTPKNTGHFVDGFHRR
ncbi:hypothetical protein BCR42DRAFT_231540 [Absidia repens]|uniref:Uncharacterized protein n=1 Tax=Absidia repens TaxID=90262 RepID=A0A1X2ILP5_9FUNG|nr:hypothetical protein BCR42DRAFT_231540 [Absidia repens]